jgi:hypothetical protein
MSRPDSSRTGYPSDYRRPTTNRRSGPAPAPAAEPDQGGDPGVAADIRRSAIDRLMWMNTRHASNAWELRRRDPIAPHGLAMLFAQPDERLAFSHRYRLTAATRLWLAGYDGGGLDHRLFNYHHKIAGELSAPGSDIRDLADKRDPEMADDAVYVGLGVSSLDTSTGTWADLVTTATVPALDRSSRTHVSRAGGSTARVTSEHDIPGCIRILLTDGTTIVAERRGQQGVDPRRIISFLQ